MWVYHLTTNMVTLFRYIKLFLLFLRVSRNTVLLHNLAIFIDIEGILDGRIACPSKVSAAILFYSYFRCF